MSEIIKQHLGGRSAVVMSALHWGEVAGVVHKVHGRQAMELALSRLYTFGFEIASVDAQRATRAALIKLGRTLPCVDAFGIELAASTPQAVFVTADFDFKPASRDVTIEFLPVK